MAGKKAPSTTPTSRMGSKGKLTPYIGKQAARNRK